MPVLDGVDGGGTRRGRPIPCWDASDDETTICTGVAGKGGGGREGTSFRRRYRWLSIKKGTPNVSSPLGSMSPSAFSPWCAGDEDVCTRCLFDDLGCGFVSCWPWRARAGHVEGQEGCVRTIGGGVLGLSKCASAEPQTASAVASSPSLPSRGHTHPTGFSPRGARQGRSAPKRPRPPLIIFTPKHKSCCALPSLLLSCKCDGFSLLLPCHTQAHSLYHPKCIAGTETGTGRTWWRQKPPRPPRLANLGHLTRRATSRLTTDGTRCRAVRPQRDEAIVVAAVAVAVTTSQPQEKRRRVL